MSGIALVEVMVRMKNRMRRLRQHIPAVTFVVLVPVALGFPRSWALTDAPRGMTEAVAWIKGKSGDTGGIVATNYPVTSMAAFKHTRHMSVWELGEGGLAALKDFDRQGFHFLLVDPQRFYFYLMSERPREREQARLLQTIEDECRPAVRVPYLNRAYLERFIYENAYADFSKTLRLVGRLTAEDGTIKAYEIAPCVEAIGKTRGSEWSN